MSDEKVIYQNLIKKNKEECDATLEKEREKWEFRYNNQINQILELKDTIKKLQKGIRKLRKELKDG